MGCDIHVAAERRSEKGWLRVPINLFDYRDYGLFGFLADVRNYSEVPPISAARGLPSDFKWVETHEYEFEIEDTNEDLHSTSWLSIAELKAFDYDAEFEDRRVTVQTAWNTWNCGATSDPGGGQKTTFRDFLGEHYFRETLRLRTLLGLSASCSALTIEGRSADVHFRASPFDVPNRRQRRQLAVAYVTLIFRIRL